MRTTEMKGLAATLLASALILASPLSAMPPDEGADYLQPGHRFADSADHITQECMVLLYTSSNPASRSIGEYLDYDGNDLTITWDADLTCDDEPHYVTVIWIIWKNGTGEWTDLDPRGELRYLTYHQDVDYVDLTMVDFPPGRYDILVAFYFTDEGQSEEYAGKIVWYDIRILGEDVYGPYEVGDNTSPQVFAIVVSLVILVLFGRVVQDRLE